MPCGQSFICENEKEHKRLHLHTNDILSPIVHTKWAVSCAAVAASFATVTNVVCLSSEVEALYMHHIHWSFVFGCCSAFKSFCVFINDLAQSHWQCNSDTDCDSLSQSVHKTPKTKKCQWKKRNMVLIKSDCGACVSERFACAGRASVIHQQKWPPMTFPWDF